MPIEIQELVTQVEVVDSEAVLDPRVFARIVEQVLAASRDRERTEQARRSELDIRPIVEQQRDRGRWSPCPS
jgi:hypothetical protein